MRGLEVDCLAGMMIAHVVHRTSSVELADICFLCRNAALLPKLVLIWIKRDLQHLGMIHGQQLADFLFHDPVVAFTEDAHHDLSLGIDEKPVRPSLGLVRLPDGALLVGDHRPWQMILLRSHANIVDVEADLELAIVHANHLKAIGVIFRVPALNYAEIADAIDAGVLPEIDEYDLAVI